MVQIVKVFIGSDTCTYYATSRLKLYFTCNFYMCENCVLCIFIFYNEKCELLLILKRS